MTNLIFVISLICNVSALVWFGLGLWINVYKNIDKEYVKRIGNVWKLFFENKWLKKYV